MKILIDADGCPVVDITVTAAKKFNVECLIICDTAHFIERNGARTITVDKGADSADFVIVNMIKPGDIVITQDYALAAMCLARRAFALSQNGMMYTDNNIDGLLMQRHTAKKIRSAGGRLKGPAKRTKAQDEAFEAELLRLLN